MSRRRRTELVAADEQVARRRRSASHRSLRRRADRGAGAFTAAATPMDDAAATTVRSSSQPASVVDRTPTAELTPPSWLSASDDAEVVADADAAVDDSDVQHDGLDGADSADGADIAPQVRRMPTVLPPLVSPPTVEPDLAAESDETVEPDLTGEPNEAAEPDGSAALADAADPGEHTVVFEPVDDTAVHEPVDAAGVHEPVDDTMAYAPVGDTRTFEPEVDTTVGVPASPTVFDPEPTTAQSGGVPPVAGPDSAGPDSAGPGIPGPDHVDPAAADTPAYPSQPPRKRRSRAFLAVPLAIVVLVAAYVGVQAWLADTVPRDTWIMGTDVGGLSSTEARDTLGTYADDRSTEPITIIADDREFQITPLAAGLTVDTDATVDQVVGFTLQPNRLWQHITGGGAVLPVITVDETALDEAMAAAADELDRAAQDADVVIEGVTAQVVPSVPGIVVDHNATGLTVSQMWTVSSRHEAVIETVEPALTDADAQTFADRLTTEAFATALQVSSEHGDVELSPGDIAAAAAVTTDRSGYVLEIDGTVLRQTLVELNGELELPGESASFDFDSSQQLSVDPGTPGRGIDTDALGASVAAAVLTTDRAVDVEFTDIDPDTTADQLGIDDFQEVVAAFDTPLTADAPRTQNLRVAAASVQGTVLQPGDRFDLTEVLSPVSPESGYQNSGVIVNGVLVQGMGGGLSQMATTAFNAAYFAGFDLIEHRPHSVWFTRYPAGREATLYTGQINVVFENSTPYAAVLNSYVSGGSLHVEVWSTPHFDVETYASERTNVRQPGVNEITSANCVAKSAGQPGFTITNTRELYLQDEMVDSESFTWTYQPDDAIRCVSDDDEDDD